MVAALAVLLTVSATVAIAASGGLLTGMGATVVAVVLVARRRRP